MSADKYKHALRLAIGEALRNPTDWLWTEEDQIVCHTCCGYFDGICLLCAEGEMEMLEDSGKFIRARFVTHPVIEINPKLLTRVNLRWWGM